MSRKKSKRRPQTHGRISGDGQPTQESAQGDQASSSDRPRRFVRTALSIWLVIHLGAILVSFTGVVEPSTIHARLSQLVYPYLRPAHFSADDRPVYLAHGDAAEQPHMLQVSADEVTDASAVDSYRWRTVGPQRNAGLAVSDRVARWLSTAAMLAENEQPSLVAELLLPIVQRETDANAVRIVRLPTGLSDVTEESQSPYVARVVREQNVVTLVQLNPARLSSRVVETSGGPNDE